MSVSTFPQLDDTLQPFSIKGLYLIPRAVLPDPLGPLFIAGRPVAALADCPWDSEQVLLTTEHPDILHPLCDHVIELR